MKLMYAIVNKLDEDSVVRELNKNGFGVTRLASTGGFMRSGNTTLIIGLDEEKVEQAIKIIHDECGPRRRVTVNMPPMFSSAGYGVGSAAVDVGGATVFVMDVERFEKI
jgi:uncharacterized protein YaaQ